MKTTSRRGFTLIELLVVIAIVSIIAALLFPVFARAKFESRKAKCQSNLKQINTAFQLYSADWSDSYPNNGDPFLWMGRRWRWTLKRYLVLAVQRDSSNPGNPNTSTGNKNSVVLCPEDPAAKSKFDATSYGYSLAFYHTPEQVNSMTTADEWSGTPPANITQTTASVKYPSRKAMVAEWTANHSDYRNAAGNPASWWESGGARNYLFADGHVKCIDWSNINPALNGFPDINLTRDGIAGADIK